MLRKVINITMHIHGDQIVYTYIWGISLVSQYHGHNYSLLTDIGTLTIRQHLSYKAAAGGNMSLIIIIPIALRK